MASRVGHWKISGQEQIGSGLLLYVLMYSETSVAIDLVTDFWLGEFTHVNMHSN